MNQATGAATLIGPILVGATPICLTGLASHPVTHVLYGIVSNNCANDVRGFVSINTATGAATLIGTMAIGGSDLSFDAAGTLFVWQPSTRRLATINLATGAATQLGASGLASTTGGGLAINGAGTAFLSASAANGTLDTVDTTTGVDTAGPPLTGAPHPDAINAMAFSPGGVLFAVNSDTAGPVANTNLVRINTGTGAVTNIGVLPGDTDAIAFAPAAAGPQAVPTLNSWMMLAMALAIAGVGALALRRRTRSTFRSPT